LCSWLWVGDKAAYMVNTGLFLLCQNVRTLQYTHGWEVMQMEQPHTMSGCAVHLAWCARTQRQLACHLKLQQHSCSTVGRQSPAPLEQEALSHLLRPGLLLWRARAIGNMTCVFFRGSWLEALLPRTWDWLWLSEAHRQLKRNDSSIHYISKKSRHYRQYSYSWTDNRIKYSSNWLNRPPAHNAQ